MSILSHAPPYVPCDHCPGDGPCPVCGDSGWLPADVLLGRLERILAALDREEAEACRRGTLAGHPDRLESEW
jgi:hypothetical protein